MGSMNQLSARDIEKWYVSQCAAIASNKDAHIDSEDVANIALMLSSVTKGVFSRRLKTASAAYFVKFPSNMTTESELFKKITNLPRFVALFKHELTLLN